MTEEQITQKAEMLIDKFEEQIDFSDLYVKMKPNRLKEQDDCYNARLSLAKGVATICVDEIINHLDNISMEESGTTEIDYGQFDLLKIKEKIQSL